MGIGLGEGLLITAIVTLCFGGKKIPQLGKTLGESIRGFKEGMHSKEDKKSENENQEDKTKNS